MGLYRTGINKLKARNGGKNPPLYQKATIGAISGAIGGWCSSPTDLIMVRFQNDNLLPPKKKRNYTGFFNAASRMIKEEGI